MKVLHVLHHSLPYLDGYSIRSKYIVEFQRKLGLTPIVVTSAHHEIEVGHHLSGEFQPKEIIDDQVYYRTQLPGGWLNRFQSQKPFLRERFLIKALRKRIPQVLREEQVDIVHAHSPIICGLPALKVAKSQKIPIVYEVRAFWGAEFSRRWKLDEKSLKYRLSRPLEMHLFRNANAVVAISQHMIDDIVARGIDAKKVFKVPNGVDATRFTLREKDTALLDKYQLHSCTVVGFIGSFYRFEGLESLIRAMPKVVEKSPSARLLLVGGGEEEQNILQLIQELQLEAFVIFVGRVPHAEVLRYYSVMDVLVYPRYSNRTTNLVTPLKPLEAMAMGKAVIGSDVGGIRELFDDGKVGVLFEAGSPNDLADKILCLVNRSEERQAIAEEARRYILKQRSWEHIISGYVEIYERLLT